jgi:hypothetical protein
MPGKGCNDHSQQHLIMDRCTITLNDDRNICANHSSSGGEQQREPQGHADHPNEMYMRHSSFTSKILSYTKMETHGVQLFFTSFVPRLPEDATHAGTDEFTPAPRREMLSCMTFHTRPAKGKFEICFTFATRANFHFGRRSLTPARAAIPPYVVFGVDYKKFFLNYGGASQTLAPPSENR